MLNVRPYTNKEQLLFPASIGDYLSKDDLAHVVDEAVDEIDLTPYYRKISDVGNPPYHPALMLKIWFYGYCTQTCSSRKIEEKLYKDVAFIYLAGMQKPDFKAISEFRRKHLSELKHSFADILHLCHRLGLTRLGEISIDSKVMKANAAARRTYDEKELMQEREDLEKAIQDYLEKVNQVDVDEDQTYGSDQRGNELPEAIRPKEERIKKMKQMAEQLKQAQKKLKEGNKKKINLTDSDAPFQKDKTRILPGYRAQVAVDSKEQIIVAQDVTREQCDASQLLPMVDEVCKAVKELNQGGKEEEKLKIIADSRYNSELNLAALEQSQNVDAYMPDMKAQARQRGHKTPEDSPYHWSQFTFDKEENGFICPVGKKLPYVKQKTYRNRIFSLYTCKECHACRYLGTCTTDKKGRSIWLSEYMPLVLNMRQKLSTPEGKKIYGMRKITVEPVLGNLSQNLGFREFLLRGLEKVKGEFSLMCTAHNLRKIARRIKRSGVTLQEALRMPTLSPLSACMSYAQAGIPDTS